MSEHELNDNEYLHEIECVEERELGQKKEKTFTGKSTGWQKP